MLHTLVENKSRKRSRIALGILSMGLLLSASGTSTLWLTGCSLCGDEFLKKISSPDGYLDCRIEIERLWSNYGGGLECQRS